MTIVARLNSFGGVADSRELFAFLDDCGIGGRKRRKRAINACIICSDICNFVRRQGLGDRRHDGIRPRG
jgi:hypothetical protein